MKHSISFILTSSRFVRNVLWSLHWPRVSRFISESLHHSFISLITHIPFSWDELFLKISKIVRTEKEAKWWFRNNFFDVVSGDFHMGQIRPLYFHIGPSYMGPLSFQKWHFRNVRWGMAFRGFVPLFSLSYSGI